MIARPASGSAPAWALAVWLGLVCQEIGAALAVMLFPAVGAVGMVALRLVFSAAVLLTLARPTLRGHGGRDWWAVARFGLAIAVMNSLFYLALDRLALGVAVTLEVLGPLALSVVVARRPAAWAWAGLALVGVVALGGGGWDRLDPWGVLFALGAAVMWAAYIRAASDVGRAFPKLEGLALSMVVGSLAVAPFAIVTAGSALVRPDILLLGLGVAVLSSAIPYGLELVALRRLHQAAFGILMSLAPATAALAGWILLGQALSWLEIAGLATVVVASAGAVLLKPRDVPGEEPSKDPFADTGPITTSLS